MYRTKKLEHWLTSTIDRCTEQIMQLEQNKYRTVARCTDQSSWYAVAELSSTVARCTDQSSCYAELSSIVARCTELSSWYAELSSTVAIGVQN